MSGPGPQPDEPNYFVLIAPGADSNDPTPSWVDVSTDLRSVSIQRGADKHLDEDQPGTATITLNNFEGTYDNDNSGSPYVGQLITDMRVRVLAEWDGDLYERFNGYLDDIDLEYPDGDADAWAVFHCTDAFKVLAGATLASSAYAAEVLFDGPVALWRLNETADTAIGDPVFDAVGGFDLVVADTLAGASDFGVEGIISRESGTAVELAANSSLRGYSAPGVVSAPPLSVEAVFAITNDGAIMSIATDAIAGSVPRAYLQVLAGAVVFTADDGPSAAVSVASGSGYTNGLPHHVIATWAASGALALYVDGVLVDSDTGAGTVNFAGGAVTTIGGSTGPTIGQTAPPGKVQMVAVYDQVLSATRAAAHAEVVATPWNNDTPGQRAGRVLDLLDWPDLLRDLDTGVSVLQSADLGETALEHLLKVAASEFGELHISKEGAVLLRERNSLINRDPLAEFGPDADEVRYRTIRFASGADLVRNPVTVSRAEGVAQTVEADRTYYPHQFTLDGLLHNSDTLSRSAAEFFLSEFKDQKRRVNGLTFGPFEGERLFDWFPLLLEAELGDVYQVTFRPPNGDDLVQISVLEGTEESWSADTGIGEISWSLSMAYAGGGAFWQLGIVGRSELGLTTRLYF